MVATSNSVSGFVNGLFYGLYNILKPFIGRLLSAHALLLAHSRFGGRAVSTPTRPCQSRLPTPDCVSPHCPAPFDYGYLVRLAMQPVLDSIVSLGARSETRLQSTLEPSGLPLRMPFSEKNRRERSELGGSVWSHSLRKYATLTIGLLFVNFPVCPVPTTLRTSILSVW